MGEYYDWVNVDRKEYICPNDFDCGNRNEINEYGVDPLIGNKEVQYGTF